MKSSTTISIVTPSFNQGEFLEDTLRSVTDQASENFTLQYIIQDNCSTDTTPEVLARYEGANNMHVRIQADTGQADALNRGFEYSNGSLLGWVNSDDVLLPGALETVVEVFERNPGVDVVYGDAFFISASGIIQARYPTPRFDGKLLLSTCCLSQPSVFFRRSIFDKVGGLQNDLHYCLDYNLWLRFYRAGADFSYIGKALSATRFHDATKLETAGKQYVDEIHRMLLDELGYIPSSWEFYYEYCREKDFHSKNNLLKFMRASYRFLRNNPTTISEVIPFVSYVAKHKLINQLARHRFPFGAHYTSLK